MPKQSCVYINNDRDDENDWTPCSHIPNYIIMRICYIICMSPFSSHIRIRLFHHAWLVNANLVNVMLQRRSSRDQQRPKPACDIQVLISKKSRHWVHLEQQSTSLICDNSDFLIVRKYWTRCTCISQISWTRFVERKCVKCPKTNGLYTWYLQQRENITMKFLFVLNS